MDLDKLRMDAGEFDRIMRRALQVKPADGKPKAKAKTKARKTRANREA